METETICVVLSIIIMCFIVRFIISISHENGNNEKQIEQNGRTNKIDFATFLEQNNISLDKLRGEDYKKIMENADRIEFSRNLLYLPDTPPPREELKKRIEKRVKSWHLLNGQLRYYSLMVYVPYNSKLGDDPISQKDRELIWNFKNSMNISKKEHQEALNTIVPQIEALLYKTFDYDLINLTLVCLPASSMMIHERRYKDFSEKVCFSKMQNGYAYIKILKSKLAKREGGHSINFDNINFDRYNLKNKLIIIFDDIITSGDSMIKFKNELEKLGAYVIAGISLGKTL